MFNKIKSILQKNKLINKIMTNYVFRTIFFSLGSFVIGVVYATFNLVEALIYHDLWCGALSGYYFMLDIIRGGLLLNRYRLKKRNVEEEKRNVYEIKQYLICGILLIIMTALLSAMIIHIVRQDKIFDYAVGIIYMAAGYTFCRIGIAVYNFVTSRQYHNFTARALRCINLATAGISFLSLQSAALTAFSTSVNQTVVNAMTGGIVCGLIVILGGFMIISTILQLKRNKNRETV